jgi:hypothetical protein
MKLSTMKIDPALTEQGDRVENIPDPPGIRIRANGDDFNCFCALVRAMDATISLSRLPQGQAARCPALTASGASMPRPLR